MLRKILRILLSPLILLSSTVIVAAALSLLGIVPVMMIIMGVGQWLLTGDIEMIETGVAMLWYAIRAPVYYTYLWIVDPDKFIENISS